MSDFIFIFHVMSLCWHEHVSVIFTHELSLIYSEVLFFIQVEELQSVRDQLFLSGFSSEVKPLSSERTGSEYQRPAGLSSEGAAWSKAEFNLSTGDSEVNRWLESVHAAFISMLLNTVSITDPGSVLQSRICGYQVNFRFSFLSPTKLVHFLRR